MKHTFLQISHFCERRFFRIFSLLIPTLMFSTGVHAQITIQAENETLRSVLKKIDRQTDYSFFYNEGLGDLRKKVSLHVKNVSIETALNQLLKETNIAYSIQGKTIVLTAKQKIFPQDNSITSPARLGIRVSGSIRDADGESLIGVSIYVRDAGIRATTNINGEFEMSNVPSDATLYITYIGMKPKVVSLNGRSSLTIIMEEENNVLDDIVVTAMGIERKVKSLTYASQEIGNEELLRVQDANFVNSLQGKVAGLSVTPTVGGAGGASKILLRGNKSVLGNNAPLIVIDGIPISNSINGNRGIKNTIDLGYSFYTEGSDALCAINPDDIESIHVLKGANAAALYGSAASNGVLMISTKKGEGGSIKVEVKSNVVFENPLILPQIQNRYGAEVNTVTGSVAGESWGKAISDMTESELAVKHLTNQTQNYIQDFYKTGKTNNNSISISGGNENILSYFSYGNTNTDGMLENNKYNRHTIAFRNNFNLFESRLKIDASVNYVSQRTKNRPGGGTSLNPLYNLYTSPRNIDMDFYKNNYQITDGEWTSNKYQYYQLSNKTYIWASGYAKLKGPKQNWVYISADQNNPYWLLNKVNRVEYLDRIYANISAELELFNGLSVQARLGIDHSREFEKSEVSATTQFPSYMLDYGEYREYSYNSKEFYLDWMLKYNYSFGDYKFSSSAGYTAHQISGLSQSLLVDKATIEDPLRRIIPTAINIFDPRAGITGGRGYGKSINWDEGVFFTGQLSFKDYLFLEGSYRHDWYRAFRQFAATRGTPDNYGYFSLGLGALMHDFVNLPEFWNYLKLRTSYSEVGNSIPNIMYSSTDVNLLTGAATPSPYSYFENPIPEKTKSFEMGFDASFFKNTLFWEMTFYNSTMNNNYLLVGSSGKQKPVNTGVIRNRGVETTLSYAINLAKEVYWRTGVNFSYNNNKILQTFKDSNGNEGLIEQQIGFGGKVQIRFREGGSYGDLYATDFLRDETGKIILTNEGKPSLDNNKFGVYMGNMNAPFLIGWNNRFSYRGINFYFLIDGKVGGKVISFTEAFLDFEGLSTRTGDAREHYEANKSELTFTYTDSHGKELSVPGMRIEDGQLTSIEAYYRGIGGDMNATKYVYDATNFRLRELSLGYTFQNLFGHTKSLSVSLIGKNLLFLCNKAPVDPDTSISIQNGLGYVDVFNMPSARSFGIALSATF